MQNTITYYTAAESLFVGTSHDYPMPCLYLVAMQVIDAQTILPVQYLCWMKTLLLKQRWAGEQAVRHGRPDKYLRFRVCGIAKSPHKNER